MEQSKVKVSTHTSLIEYFVRAEFKVFSPGVQGVETCMCGAHICRCELVRVLFAWLNIIMIDWVSIVRHSRRRFSNYVGTRAPIRMKKRRRTPPSGQSSSTAATSPQDDRHQYTCCCTHVSFSSSSLFLIIIIIISRSSSSVRSSYIFIDTNRHACVYLWIEYQLCINW